MVSDETLTGGFKVNQLRKERGLDSLDIHPIKLLDDFQACDGEEAKISSSSLRRRSLGTRLKPVKVGILINHSLTCFCNNRYGL